MMKPAEVRELSSEELEQKEQELREELFNLTIQHATGQLENTSRIVHVKKDIARVRTIQKERTMSKGAEHA
jgi:large subunit ribosomal protein L29